MPTQLPAQRGFTYLGLLVAVVVMGLLLTAVGRVWSTTEQRERETQLLFVGHEFRSAIGRFVAHNSRYPLTLQELLGEEDSPVPRRYLRRLYFDPMTASANWQLVDAAGGGIMGVASASTRTPIKRGNFSYVDAGFADSDCYCQWQFIYIPRHVNKLNPSKNHP